MTQRENHTNTKAKGCSRSTTQIISSKCTSAERLPLAYKADSQVLPQKLQILHPLHLLAPITWKWLFKACDQVMTNCKILALQNFFWQVRRKDLIDPLSNTMLSVSGYFLLRGKFPKQFLCFSAVLPPHRSPGFVQINCRQHSRYWEHCERTKKGLLEMERSIRYFTFEHPSFHNPPFLYFSFHL